MIAATWWGVGIGVLVGCAWMAAAACMLIAAVEHHWTWWLALALFIAGTAAIGVWANGHYFGGVSAHDRCVDTGGMWVDTGRNKTVLVGKVLVVRNIYACVEVEGLP